VLIGHGEGGGILTPFFEAGYVAALFTLMSIVMLVATRNANRVVARREAESSEDAEPTTEEPAAPAD
jgi:hypothetical protein